MTDILDEMSDETLNSYKDKAKKDIHTLSFKASRATYDGDKSKHFEMIKKLMKRKRNIDVADTKINEDELDENLHQSSKEGEIADGTNKNLGPVKKMMGNKTTVNAYLKLLAKQTNKE